VIGGCLPNRPDETALLWAAAESLGTEALSLKKQAKDRSFAKICYKLLPEVDHLVPHPCISMILFLNPFWQALFEEHRLLLFKYEAPKDSERTQTWSKRKQKKSFVKS